MADRAHRADDRQAADLPAARRQRAPEHRIARLQRQVGNRAVAAYVKALAVQRVKEGDGPTHGHRHHPAAAQPASAATPRLAITGRFDAATTTATKAFQKKLIGEKVAGVAEDGIVDGITHAQLKARAPSVNISNNDTVVVGPGNTQVPSNPALRARTSSCRPARRAWRSRNCRNGSTTAGSPPAQKLVVDGVFGPKTDAGPQGVPGHAMPLPATGIADPATWAKLETAGAATQGHVEFDWLRGGGGVKDVGLTAGVRLEAVQDRAEPSPSGINFRKKHDERRRPDRPVAGRHQGDLEHLQGGQRQRPEEEEHGPDFEAQCGGQDHDVDVFQFDPTLPKKQTAAQSRSDSGTWYTIDPRRSMAPHEFGHLIGLADEYNRTEEHYLGVTGEEPAVGDPAGVAADATKLAADIKAKLPLDDKLAAPIAATDDKRLGREPGRRHHPDAGRASRAASPAWSPRSTPKANAGAVGLRPTSRRPSATRTSPASRRTSGSA